MRLGPERLSGRGTAVGTAPSSVSGFRAPGGRGLASTFSLAGLVSAGTQTYKAGITPGFYAFLLGGGTKSAATFRASAKASWPRWFWRGPRCEGGRLRARFIVVEGGCARAATYYLSIYLYDNIAALSISGKSVLSLIPIISSALRRFDFAVLGDLDSRVLNTLVRTGELKPVSP